MVLTDQVLPSQSKCMFSEDRGTKEGGKATLLELSHVFLNRIIKVCSIHLHLHEELWHVLEMELKN